MEYRLSVLEGTNIAEDILYLLYRFLAVLTDTNGVVRVRADGNYLSAELAEAAHVVHRRYQVNSLVNAAGVYLNALAVADKEFHYFIRDLAALALMKRCVEGILR